MDCELIEVVKNTIDVINDLQIGYKDPSSLTITGIPNFSLNLLIDFMSNTRANAAFHEILSLRNPTNIVEAQLKLQRNAYEYPKVHFTEVSGSFINLNDFC